LSRRFAAAADVSGPFGSSNAFLPSRYAACFTALPLRSGPVGCTFALAAHLPPKMTAQGISMAATRIDCDIHPAVGGTRTTLLPYLDDHWKEQVVSRAIDGLDLN